jgi:hypothetical protein
MFNGEFAFVELGSFSRFCVFHKGGQPQALRGVMRVNRSKDDEWRVMSHEFLKCLKMV